MRWRTIAIAACVVALILAVLVVAGRPQDTGAPADMGAPTDTGAPADTGAPTDTGALADTGTPGVTPQAVAGALLVGRIVGPGQPDTAVAFDATAGKLRLSHTTLGGGGSVAMLWLAAKDGKLYRMGVIWNGNGGTVISLSAADQRRIVNDTVLQVSIEPAKSTPAQPTTPIVARGVLTAV